MGLFQLEWAPAELGRFDEAEPALEKAVQLAPPGDELPLNNWQEYAG